MIDQEPSGLLSNLGLKQPCSKIDLLGDILIPRYKTNEIVSKLLLAGNKFMLQIFSNLFQPEFTYNTCVPFTKNKERIKKSK